MAMEASSMVSTGAQGMSLGVPMNEAGAGVGLSRSESARGMLAEAVERLEHRLSRALSPVQEKNPTARLESVQITQSPLAEELHAHADGLDDLATRLNGISDRIDI